jgi:PAS domain S-box-containing protein
MPPDRPEQDATDLAKDQTEIAEFNMPSLFALSPDAILVTDMDGIIRDSNPQAAQLLGYAQAELTGMRIEALLPERFRDRHLGYRENWCAQHNGDHNGDRGARPLGAAMNLFCLRKDGTECPVEILFKPTQTKAGRMVLSFIRDTTGRGAAPEAIAVSNAAGHTEDPHERATFERQVLVDELNADRRFEDIVGESSGLRNVLNDVATVAPTDATVLIQGETGTGKELLARAIHRLSLRNERPFITLNCAAIPPGLLESELFGHEKGAFTGAIRLKLGRLELAQGGTLFLDEIGELPLDLQPKVLRALQEREIERLGGTELIKVNARLIAATNCDLARLVEKKQFRADLFYRLRVFPIFAPSLRDRASDIPALVRHFVSIHSRHMGKAITTIPEATMEALMRWKWPGNIRELENFLERAVILTRGSVLYAPLAELEPVGWETAEPETQRHETADRDAATQHLTHAAAERQHIVNAMREAKGHISGERGAAARLGLPRTTLNSKLKKLAIAKIDYM